MIEKLESFDQQLFLYLNGLHTSWLDTLMYLVSQGWFWFPLFAFFIFHLAKRYPSSRNRIIVFGTLALTVGLTDGASTWVIKKQVKRYRPTHNLEIGHEVHTVPTLVAKSIVAGNTELFLRIAQTISALPLCCFGSWATRKDGDGFLYGLH